MPQIRDDTSQPIPAKWKPYFIDAVHLEASIFSHSLGWYQPIMHTLRLVKFKGAPNCLILSYHPHFSESLAGAANADAMVGHLQCPRARFIDAFLNLLSSAFQRKPCESGQCGCHGWAFVMPKGAFWWCVFILRLMSYKLSYMEFSLKTRTRLVVFVRNSYSSKINEELIYIKKYIDPKLMQNPSKAPI